MVGSKYDTYLLLPWWAALPVVNYRRRTVRAAVSATEAWIEPGSQTGSGRPGSGDALVTDGAGLGRLRRRGDDERDEGIGLDRTPLLHGASSSAVVRRRGRRGKSMLFIGCLSYAGCRSWLASGRYLIQDGGLLWLDRKVTMRRVVGHHRIFAPFMASCLWTSTRWILGVLVVCDSLNR